MEAEEMDVWKNQVQQDISDLKLGQTKMKDDIINLQLSDKLQDQEINTIKATLSDIKEDTNWIRRKITGAIITAVITALIGGLIAIAVTQIFNNGGNTNETKLESKI